jgi:hypothetical protein
MKFLPLLFIATLAASAQTVQLVPPNDAALAIAQTIAATPAGPVGSMLGSMHALIVPHKVAVVWEFQDETRVWLSIINTNHRDWDKEGYHPNWTAVISNYKPVVQQLDNGKYQITFTSGVAKDLP